MHIQHRNTAVDDIHAVKRKDVGDRSAASEIDFADLRRLENDLSLLTDRAKMGNVLGIRVVGAGLSPGARELVEHQSASQESCIFLLKGRSVIRIIRARHVRGEHAGIRKAAS